MRLKPGTLVRFKQEYLEHEAFSDERKMLLDEYVGEVISDQNEDEDSFVCVYFHGLRDYHNPRKYFKYRFDILFVPE